MINRTKRGRSSYRKRQLRLNVALTALVGLVIIIVSTVLGLNLPRQVALTNDAIASVYLFTLALLYLVVSLLITRPRRR